MAPPQQCSPIENYHLAGNQTRGTCGTLLSQAGISLGGRPAVFRIKSHVVSCLANSREVNLSRGELPGSNGLLQSFFDRKTRTPTHLLTQACVVSNNQRRLVSRHRQLAET